ncbi:aldo-keto reductase family protein [Acrasis kona]|uniref:Aldo-keto reductase family protein n=1 Tax=Acrasis kona TaxID=1008807 RepID=A0AAW2ZBU4_9EUKA
MTRSLDNFFCGGSDPLLIPQVIPAIISSKPGGLLSIATPTSVGMLFFEKTQTPSPSPLPIPSQNDITQIRLMIKEAIKSGYRHIDCAELFTGFEKQVGIAVSEALMECELKRSDVFITCMLSSIGMVNCKKACMNTIKDLQTDYIDLYLIDFTLFSTLCKTQRFSFDHDSLSDNSLGDLPKRIRTFARMWRTMEKLVKNGFVRNIGLIGCPEDDVDYILSFAKIRPVLMGSDSNLV